jgi:ABC-type Fe3+-hydroxamate transport system substrate-binding protein
VGGGLEPNLEAILAMQPDLVIRFAGEEDPRTPARLDEFGVQHVAVRPIDLGDVYATNLIVGRAVGRGAAADSLNAVIRRELDGVAESASRYRTLEVVYTLGGSPPWVSGPGTFVDSILSIAGARNVFDDLASPWAPVSPEEFVMREIDVILVPRAGNFDQRLASGRIVEVGSLFDLPGPNVADAARALLALLHGPNRP